MKNILIRWALSAAAIAGAAYVIPGIRVEGNGIIAVLVFAVILGLVNAVLKPLISLFSIGFIILTLGLFMLVINALTLWGASYVAVNWFHIGFYVDGFWAAFWGSIMISILTMIFSIFIKDDDKK
ncbi:MAG: phage holin family protein [Candidatus Saccharibacteria bacterium]